MWACRFPAPALPSMVGCCLSPSTIPRLLSYAGLSSLPAAVGPPSPLSSAAVTPSLLLSTVGPPSPAILSLSLHSLVLHPSRDCPRSHPMAICLGVGGGLSAVSKRHLGARPMMANRRGGLKSCGLWFVCSRQFPPTEKKCSTLKRRWYIVEHSHISFVCVCRRRKLKKKKIIP